MGKDHRANEQATAAARINRQWPSNEHVRAVECFLLRHGTTADSPLQVLENFNPGGGIVVAWDSQGRQFKIEITQVDGPI